MSTPVRDYNARDPAYPSTREAQFALLLIYYRPPTRLLRRIATTPRREIEYPLSLGTRLRNTPAAGF